MFPALRSGPRGDYEFPRSVKFESKLDTDLLKKMESSVEINEADKNAFIKASGPIYDEFGTTVPGGVAQRRFHRGELVGPEDTDI